MSGGVNLLGVLDQAIERERQAGQATVAQVAARAAVAELIEADKEYDAAIAEAKELNREVAENGWLEVKFDALRKSGERVVRAQRRRQDALANVDGAA